MLSIGDDGGGAKASSESILAQRTPPPSSNYRFGIFKSTLRRAQQITLVANRIEGRKICF